MGQKRQSNNNRNNTNNANSSTTNSGNKTSNQSNVDPDEIKAELQRQLEVVILSQNTLNIVIIGSILSAVNVNKIRVQLEDQINGTNNASCLPDTREIQALTSILFVYATFIFLKIAADALNEGIRANNPNINGLYQAYFASLLVFVASLIRYFNLDTPSENLEGDF